MFNVENEAFMKNDRSLQKRKKRAYLFEN